MVQRICQHCGKVYETIPSVRLKYCSQACTGAAKVKATTKPCAICGKPFKLYPSRPGRLYCSKSCAATARNLTEANPAYHRDFSGEKNPMFGKGFKGAANPMYGKRKEDSPRWNNGIKTRPDSYLLVVVPDNHPHPSYVKKSGTKYLLYHRFLIEQHIGRYLRPEEVVHHKDGNPRNNNLDNLELFASQAEHISRGHARRTKR